MRKYIKADFVKLLAGCELLAHQIGEEGVTSKDLQDAGLVTPREKAALEWTPHGEGRLALAFPFTAKELAAFCLAGDGRMIYENWLGGNDLEVFELIGSEQICDEAMDGLWGNGRPAIEAIAAAHQFIREAAAKFNLHDDKELRAASDWLLSEDAEPASQAAEVAQAAPAMGEKGQGKVWTDDRKAEVRAYREKHGLKQTANFYGVSQATISKHVPAKEESTPLGFSVFSHRIK